MWRKLEKMMLSMNVGRRTRVDGDGLTGRTSKDGLELCSETDNGCMIVDSASGF